MNNRAFKMSWLVLTGPLALTALFFYDLFFTEDIFADRDILNVYIPMAHYWKERISAGGFPDWYPYDGLGQPFVGNLFGLAFHPIQWLCLALPAAIAVKWEILLCFPFAFIGFYRFIQCFKVSVSAAVIGALVYAFNGYSVSMTNNFSYLLGLAQLPWAYWLTLRALQKSTPSRIFLAALAYALILFGGETQTFILACATGVLSVFVFEDKKRIFHALGVYLAVMTATALLSAVQWVPSLHLMSQASAGASDFVDKALIWSLHPLRLLEFIFGGLTGNDYDSGILFRQTIYKYHFSEFWARSVLITLPVFLFFLVGVWRKKRLNIFLGSAFIFFLLLALGKHVGLYEAMRVIPLFRPFRYPEKLVSFLMMIISIWASLGFSRMENAARDDRRITHIFIFGIFLAQSFLLFEYFHGWSRLALERLSSFKETIPGSVSSAIHEQSMLFQTISFLGVISTVYFFRKNRRMMGICSFVLIASLLWIGSRGVYSPGIKDIAERPVQPVDVIKQNASSEPPRFATMSLRLSSEIAREYPELRREIQRMINVFLLAGIYPGLFELEPMSFYMPGASQRYRSIMEKTTRRHAFDDLIGMYSGEFFTMFGADYAAFHGTIDRVLYEHSFLGALVVRNEGVMPRAYLSRPRCVISKEKSLDMVLKGSFDYRHETVVECPPEMTAPGTIPNDVDLGTATILSRQPEHVVIDVNALTDGAVLVLTDAYYTGWQATLDGEPVEILPANHAVRGVMVPKGRHRVEFKYRTPGLIPAAIASASTLILGILLSFIFWARARRRMSAMPRPQSGPVAPEEQVRVV